MKPSSGISRSSHRVGEFSSPGAAFVENKGAGIATKVHLENLLKLDPASAGRIGPDFFAFGRDVSRQRLPGILNRELCRH